MKKFHNEAMQETYVKTTLQNGLDVVIIEKPGYAKSHFLFVTPFGAAHSKLLDEQQQTISFTDGLAHFLEHKMFESEHGDVLTQYSEMGISANAFTSYFETAYYFSTTMEIEKPLNLLLDFVQVLEINEPSVEKEKGIIVQELKMYQQMSDVRFIQELFASMYHQHPLKNDIGGTEQSVNSITLKQLYDCYEINYHPQNMLLVCVSGQDSQGILEIITKNQEGKTFPDVPKVHKYTYDEPENVVRPSYTFTMDVSQKKYGLGIKMHGIEDSKQRSQLDMALKILLEGTFSSAGKYMQPWLDARYINDSFSYDSDLGEDYGFLILTSETEQPDVLEAKFMEALTAMKEQLISEEALASMKRKLMGYQIRILNRFEDYAISYARAKFLGLDFYERLTSIADITMQDLQTIADAIELTKCARVVLEGKNKAD